MITATLPNSLTVLHGVTYGAYLRIRRETDGYRMTYYDGTLEIMSPEARHGAPSWLIAQIVTAVASAHRIPYRSLGSTTFSKGEPRRRKGAGKEPDKCFFFREKADIIFETVQRSAGPMDLEVTPPPDLWIEVDHRSSSKGRLPLYARLGVPEVWRLWVRSKRLWFGRREEDQYVAIDRSIALPMLTPQVVLFALGHDRGGDEGAWDRWLRQWAGTLAGP